LVLVEGGAEVAGLEGLVAKVLAVGCDLQDACGGDGLLGCIVLREVFVLVAVGVGRLDVRLDGLLAGKLTTVGNDDLLSRLVVLGGKVLDFSND
jgi:hypothetical protein